MVRENLDDVRAGIRAALAAAGRDEGAVTLIAVSKTKPISLIEEAYDCGCRDFGENKAQELCEKCEALPKDIRWHLIGHLQRNKVKYVVGKTFLIHSVDSLRLAEEIEKEAHKKQVDVDVLVEVNMAGELSKFGVSPGEAEKLVREVAKLPHLRVRGLMTIAPIVEHSEDNAVYFDNLRQLSVDIRSKNIDNISMDVLSMGMTGDYEQAVKSGATHVRVGTGIFGAR